MFTSDFQILFFSSKSVVGGARISANIIKLCKNMSSAYEKEHLSSNLRCPIDALTCISLVFNSPRYNLMVAALHKQLRAVFLPPQFYYSLEVFQFCIIINRYRAPTMAKAACIIECARPFYRFPYGIALFYHLTVFTANFV